MAQLAAMRTDFESMPRRAQKQAPRHALPVGRREPAVVVGRGDPVYRDWVGIAGVEEAHRETERGRLSARIAGGLSLF